MILRPLIFAVPLLISSAGLTQAQPVPAPIAAATAPTEEMVPIFKLADAPLDSVLQLLEQLTGRTILRPAALPTATYNIAITKPMPQSEAIRALETILSFNQIGVSPMGDNFLKVVALPSLRTEAPRMLSGSALELPSSGTIMAKLFQLNFLRANRVRGRAGEARIAAVGSPDC